MELRLRGIYAKLLGSTIGLCAMTMAGLAVLQVVLRYIFASSLMWVEEASVIIMLWMTWLGGSLLWLTNGHIVVDLLTNQFSPRMQKTMASFTDVLVIILTGTLFVVSQETLRTLGGLELDSLPIDLTIKYYPVPFGALGLVMAAILNLWSRHSRREESRHDY